MTKMPKIRIAILALGCLLAIGAGATAYFIRSASSEATDSSSTGVLMMVAVSALVLVAGSAVRRRQEQGNRNQEANKANKPDAGDA
jgi:high-affinity Fe2+/Pb2+ permease